MHSQARQPAHARRYGGVDCEAAPRPKRRRARLVPQCGMSRTRPSHVHDTSTQATSASCLGSPPRTAFGHLTTGARCSSAASGRSNRGPAQRTQRRAPLTNTPPLINTNNWLHDALYAGVPAPYSPPPPRRPALISASFGVVVLTEPPPDDGRTFASPLSHRARSSTSRATDGFVNQYANPALPPGQVLNVEYVHPPRVPSVRAALIRLPSDTSTTRPRHAHDTSTTRP